MVSWHIVYLSVIVPAYNEEKNIEKTVRSIFDYLKSKEIEHEILVVTDGSKDKTDSIVESLRTNILTLELIKYEQNKGKGFAVKTGFLNAKGIFRLFTDADNSTSIEHLEIFLPYINEGYSVIIGSIAVPGHTVAAGSEPIWRRVFGKLGNLFIQIMAVPGVHDTQRGFKLFTADAVESIFPKLTVEGWGFDVEALALARKFGHKIKEVPVDWKNDPNSRVKLKSYFQVLLETVKIRWNLIIGKYN